MNWVKEGEIRDRGHVSQKMRIRRRSIGKSKKGRKTEDQEALNIHHKETIEEKVGGERGLQKGGSGN